MDNVVSNEKPNPSRMILLENGYGRTYLRMYEELKVVREIQFPARDTFDNSMRAAVVAARAWILNGKLNATRREPVATETRRRRLNLVHAHRPRAGDVWHHSWNSTDVCMVLETSPITIHSTEDVVVVNWGIPKTFNETRFVEWEVDAYLLYRRKEFTEQIGSHYDVTPSASVPEEYKKRLHQWQKARKRWSPFLLPVRSSLK